MSYEMRKICDVGYSSLEKLNIRTIESDLMQIPSRENDYTAISKSKITDKNNYVSTGIGVASADDIGTKNVKELTYCSLQSSLAMASGLLAITQGSLICDEILSNNKADESITLAQKKNEYDKKNDRAISEKQINLIKKLMHEKSVKGSYEEFASGFCNKSANNLSVEDGRKLIAELKGG